MPLPRLLKRLHIILEMIKIEHTVFALPFAYMGACLAARGLPTWQTSLLILLAMVFARSAAMAFNRLIDRDIDQLNPRTANRALPLQLLTPGFVSAFVWISSSLFVLTAWLLNPLAFYLSFPALIVILGYSYTKRFTSFSHLFLGLALAIAPVGGWVAVNGTVTIEPLLIAAAVLFWVGGFDIIYSCQDFEFDRDHRLFSIPSRIGIRWALTVSALFHFAMVALLAVAFVTFQLSIVSWIGLAIVIVGLIYEHNLVKPADLSRVNAAFFTINGIISIVLAVAVGLDLCLFV